MGEIISSIICLFFVVIGSLIYEYIKKKEEIKLSLKSEFTVKSSKGILLFFMLWMIICSLGMIGVVIYLITSGEPNETQTVWIAEIILLAFFFLGTLGFFTCKYNYLVIKDNGIVIKSLFKKTRFIKYTDITYVNCIMGIQCFDSDGIQLFAVDHYHIGIDKLYSFLLNKGCIELPTPYPTKEMKDNARFMAYRRKSSLISSFWALSIFAFLFLSIGLLANSLSDFKSYENYKVIGYVESYTNDDETLKIKLKNDSNQYYVNNIVYDEINENLFKVINQDDSLILHIGYIDEYNRLNISQIEINNTIYLNMSDAEDREYSNYNAGIISSYIFFSISAIFFAFSIVFFVKLKRYSKTVFKSQI